MLPGFEGNLLATFLRRRDLTDPKPSPPARGRAVTFCTNGILASRERCTVSENWSRTAGMDSD